MQKRCDRNRKRSKRRAIYCPIHGCYLHSVSQKYPLFAETAGQLQQRGIKRQHAMMLINSHTTVAIQGEWLEAFWCENCQQSNWFHVKRDGSSYGVRLAPYELWQQVSGVMNPDGNPSVGEFTRRNGKGIKLKGDGN